MQDIKAKQARQLLGGQASGEYVCCSCGLVRAEHSLSKAIKSTFTQIDRLLLSPSAYICDACKAIYDNPDMRFKPIFCTDGLYEIIDRAQVLEIIRSPPEKFVLSVPYSFKKHHWLYAGLSSCDKAYIGTDDRTVEVDYMQYDISHIIDAVQKLIIIGVPRGEIISGLLSYQPSAKKTLQTAIRRCNIMAKKRNCRRTPEEIRVHEEAVKLRKMTDAQLVEKVRSASVAKASEAFHGLADSTTNAAKSMEAFFEAFNNADIAGIGKVTKKKIHTFAKDNGYI